jgi:elongation factor P
MANINAGEFRKGLKILHEGQPFEMLECNFVKPGKGQAMYKTRLRNLLTGTNLDITFRSGDGAEGADIRNANGMYSYFDGTSYIFMDNDSFEQVSMAADIIKEEMRYIKEGTECALMYWNDQLIGITPPKNVILEVTQTDPAARGNTATNVTKPAILETGAEVQVPSFITAGEKVKIQVETGAYLGRAQ